MISQFTLWAIPTGRCQKKKWLSSVKCRSTSSATFRPFDCSICCLPSDAVWDYTLAARVFLNRAFKKELLGLHVVFRFLSCAITQAQSFNPIPTLEPSFLGTEYLTVLSIQLWFLSLRHVLRLLKISNKFEHFYKAVWNFKLLKHFTMRDRNLSALSRELIAVKSRQRNISSSNPFKKFSLSTTFSSAWLSKTEKIFHTL